jgi:ribonuclease BN (tRNA processing enzyme)
MKLVVFGGAGGWPPAGGACSGYLVEHGGFRLFVDPGYAVLPRLLGVLDAAAIDAVLVSHGHPDHVADLSPLLRARVMHDDPAPPLPVYGLPGSLDRVLAMDEAVTVAGAREVHAFGPGESFRVGPFAVSSTALPHFVPNVGLRVEAGGRSLTYTGDAGPDEALVRLADGTDLLLADASYVDVVPEGPAGNLNSAAEVGLQARAAGAGRLVLTHLWPGTDADASRAAAGRAFDGRIDVARPGLEIDIG